VTHRRTFALCVGLASGLLAASLFFPLGCWEMSHGDPPGRQRGECPGNLTRIGVEWPNNVSGLIGALAISQIVGWSAGAIAWRRWGGNDHRRADALHL
jgi:hypothetical protein